MGHDVLRDQPSAQSGSIYEHIRVHLPASGPGLLPGGDDLPDEPKREIPFVEWAPARRRRSLRSGSSRRP